MRIRRKRRNFVPLVVTILVVLGVLAIVYYTMRTSLKNSPVYSANRVLYIMKNEDRYAFVLVDSNTESVKVLYAEKGLYDPQTGKYLKGDPVDDYAFFKEVFKLNVPQWRYVDLSGKNLKEFSKDLLGKRVDSLGDLIRGLKRREGFFDVFIVGKVVKSLSDDSNLDNSALLKLLDSLRKYDLDERTVKGITKSPITVEIEGLGSFKRLYIDEREKDGIREFLGVKG